jgi:membrane protein
MTQKPKMINRILLFVEKIPIIKQMIAISKEISIPGFNKIPIYYVLLFFVKGLFKGDLSTRAAALSFTFFLALFPLIISFFTFIPYIPIANFQNTLLSTITEIIPKATWDVMGPIVTDIISRQRGSLLSIAFISAIFFASNGVMGISKAFNHSYHEIDMRPPVKQRLVSLWLLAILAILIILAVGLVIGGKISIGYLVSHHLLHNNFGINVLIFSKWLIVMALMFLSISFIYYIAPANQKYYKFISPGSTLATIMSLLLLIGFDAYVSNFTQYNALYGSIGALIAMMIFLYFNSIVLLIGFELNVSIYQAKKSFLQN